MRYLSLIEISETVGLPRSTIEIQARSIYRKLGVSPGDLTDMAQDSPKRSRAGSQRRDGKTI